VSTLRDEVISMARATLMGHMEESADSTTLDEPETPLNEQGEVSET
jgi:hypothetical protein